jgi:phage baseplate assembly protein W
MANETYIDFDFTFAKTETNDLNKVTEIDAIRQSLKNIILTIRGELRWNPLLGTRINSMLMEKINPSISAQITNEIEFAIENFEPRVSLTEVTTDESEIDENQLTIDIVYKIISLDLTDNFTITLERIG